MKRIIILLIMIALTPYVINAEIKFGMAAYLSPGYAANGDYNEATQSIAQQYDWNQYNIEEGTENGAFSAELELRLKLQEDLIFSFGFGSISLPLGNTSIEPMQMEPMQMGPMTNSFVPSSSAFHRDVEGSAFSMTLTEYYILPVGNILEIYLGVGGEYCKGRLTYTSESFTDGELNMKTEGDFSGSGLGFHTKLLFEFKATEKFRIITGLTGKYLRISGLKGIEKTTTSGGEEQEIEGTLYSYWTHHDPSMGGGDYRVWGVHPSKYDAENMGHDVREAYIDLSGISFCLGVGYYF